MALNDEFFTTEDKPYAENLNDALLLSNVFDLTVGCEYPTMCSTANWGASGSVKKCNVSIVEIADVGSGLTLSSSGVTGTGTIKINFYPNFNAFGKITAIEWTNPTGVTCDIYDASGSLIQSNIPNGTITTQSAGLGVLQNFQLRFNLTNATLTKFKVTMANREDTRYGATVGITNVTGLENRLTSIENKNTEQDTTLSNYATRMTNIESKNTSQDTAINGKAPTDHSSTTTNYGVATTTKYGHVIVDEALNSDSVNPVQNKKVKEAIDGKANTSHTHGNISSDGKIGTASGKPIITGTGGVLTAGGFGTTSGSFCQGNDSRLSNARTPTAHNHSINDVTSLQSSLDGKAPTNHASPYNSYGVGNTSDYGHVRVLQTISTTSNQPVASGTLWSEFNNKANKAWNNTTGTNFTLYYNSSLRLAQLVYNQSNAQIPTGYNNINSFDSTYAPPQTVFVQIGVLGVAVYINNDGKIATEQGTGSTMTVGNFKFSVMWHY